MEDTKEHPIVRADMVNLEEKKNIMLVGAINTSTHYINIVLLFF